MGQEENFNSARTIGLIGVIVIVLVACGYYAGIRQSELKTDPLKKEIENLIKISEIEEIKYIKLSDSLKKNSGSHDQNIDIINEIKKAIRNEIQKTIPTINSIPDSSLQSYIDSIRSAGGFY